MTKNIALLGLIALALLVGGCSKETPLAPETNVANLESALSKPSVFQATCQMDFSKTMVDSGKVWVDDQGVLHIRNQVYKNTAITDDFVGIDLHNVFNADINLATGAGRSWGWNRSRVTWTAQNLTGLWTCKYQNEIVGGQMKGTSSYVGGCGFAGMHADAQQEETAPGSLVLIMKWNIYERNKNRARDTGLAIE
ncbi:hypothetical protein L0128_13170 [candidate division KSB1 bacterium]|nr:hypothetical protein [candidate division KSB1 bacterium]